MTTLNNVMDIEDSTAMELTGSTHNLEGYYNNLYGTINTGHREPSGYISEYLFGDITNIRGEISKHLYGDLSNLKGNVFKLVGDASNVFVDTNLTDYNTFPHLYYDFQLSYQRYVTEFVKKFMADGDYEGYFTFNIDDVMYNELLDLNLIREYALELANQKMKTYMTKEEQELMNHYHVHDVSIVFNTNTKTIDCYLNKHDENALLVSF